MVAETSTPKQWHVGNWTGLGWLETGIKLVAHVVAFVALAWAIRGPQNFGTDFFYQWGGIYGLQVIILGILTLGLMLAIADRYLEKEIIAMMFVVVNVLAHGAMFYALLRQPHNRMLSALANSPASELLPWQLLPIFAALMLLGDLVKIVFLLRTKFTVRGYSPRVLVYLTGGYVVGYALLLILSLSNPYI